MSNKLPVFEMVIDEKDEKSGVFAISLVSRPAIQVDFVALSKELYELKADEKRKVLVGPVLIPSQKIYRYDASSNQERYVYASEETIRKVCYKFSQMSYHSNTTHEHLLELDGNCIVESWIIEDSNQDKSNIYGYNLPVGTWMVTMKVDDEYWKNNVETGIVKGFSLEGFFANEYVTQFTEETQEIEIKNQIKLMISEYTINGSKYSVTDTNELVLVSDPNVIMPEGFYETEEGYQIWVNEEGKVWSIITPDMPSVEVYEMSKNSKRKMNKKKKKTATFSEFMKFFGFEFAEDELPEKEEEKEKEVIEKEETLEEEMTQITLPDGQVLKIAAEGGEMTVEDEQGRKYQITIVPVIEPVTDPAETDEPVANPVVEVADENIVEMKAHIKKLEAEIAKFKEAPKPVKMSKDDESWSNDTKKVVDAESTLARVSEMRKRIYGR